MKFYYLKEYNLLLGYILFVFLLASVLYSLNKLVKQKEFDLEKLSSYECGFDPYSSLGHSFDLHFYIIALSFLIFDLEIIFFYPWAIVLSEITLQGFFIMVYFLYTLTIVFAYEWKTGSLDWNLHMAKAVTV